MKNSKVKTTTIIVLTALVLFTGLNAAKSSFSSMNQISSVRTAQLDLIK